MFGEPARTQYDLNFTLFGFPVRVHPLFWLLGLFISSSGLGNPDGTRTWIITAVSCIAALFITVLLHELGHAFIFRKLVRVPSSIVLHGFGGVTIPSYYRNPGTRDSIILFAAGPLSGFILIGLITLIVYLVFGPTAIHSKVIWYANYIPIPFVAFLHDSMPVHLTMFLLYLAQFCIFWGVLNLLPIYPLDGGHLSREIFLWFTKYNGIVYSLRLSLIVAAAISAYELYSWITFSKGSGIPFMAIFFGMFAYFNYDTLRKYSNRYR